MSHRKHRESTLTKKEIARRVAGRLKIDQTLTKKVLQGCLDAILQAVVEQGRIELRNFGVFEVRQRAARTGRNPRTNQPVPVPAKQVVVFQAGRNVVRRLQQPPAGLARS